MTPKQAFERLLGEALLQPFGSKRRGQETPGELVLRSSEEAREALKQLTTAEVNDVREEHIRLWVEPLSLGERIARRR